MARSRSRSRSKRPLGYVLYSGPSALDGAPVVVVATMKSSNRKTGRMIQTWVLRADASPVASVRTGADASICGACPHRGDKSSGRPRTCYVNVGQAPGSVWRAWRRGRYVAGTLADAMAAAPGVPVRLGAYGDPAAVPAEVWSAVRSAPRWTGYTHQWRNPAAAALRDVVMASCDSVADAADAAAAGWRAFIVRPADAAAPLPDFVGRAIECPSARGVECARCGLCAGASPRTERAPHIWIAAHGAAAAFVAG
jgi:hypothetical protein